MRLSGWTAFSGLMLFIAGMFGILNGLVAVINDEVYVVGEGQIVAFDFTTWGWIHLIAGTVVVAAGLVVMGSGAMWARIIGVITAMLHAGLQIGFIEAYPFWSITTIGIDLIVIYGLMVPASMEEPRAA